MTTVMRKDFVPVLQNLDPRQLQKQAKCQHFAIATQGACSIFTNFFDPGFKPRSSTYGGGGGICKNTVPLAIEQFLEEKNNNFDEPFIAGRIRYVLCQRVSEPVTYD